MKFLVGMVDETLVGRSNADVDTLRNLSSMARSQVETPGTAQAGQERRIRAQKMRWHRR